ncbi:MAG: NnrS family protein, partial [Rhodocyclaceae bacterium]|nr:NnrS family protein [Rhodocyclaceae bacterium]
LVFGFAFAALAGFLLTVVPEFAGGADFGPRPVRSLVLLWLIGRLAFWISGLIGQAALAVAALSHLGLLLGLAALVAPRLWRDPERRHLAFLWGLAALAICVAGFYFDAFAGKAATRWLAAALGVLMMLILVALARISMRIVNHAIAEAGIDCVSYLARPPRRNLAIVTIALCTLAEFFLPGSRLAGWLALAAAAAILNLMNDWHIGRALFSRRPLMLYGVLVLVALGYASMGLALVFDHGVVSAGRHWLTVGALGLAIYAVMGIAGRAHCGLPFETRAWQTAGAWFIVAAAILRAAGELVAAALLWTLAWLLFCIYLARVFWRPRADGRHGCKGTAIP